jgi:hypothetical protein
MKWLLRLFNSCMNMGNVSEDWRSSIILPLFNSKGDKKECKNYRGISLLSMPGTEQY